MRALSRAPIEDDTLMALPVLAFAGQNVSVTSGTGDSLYGYAKLAPYAVRLFDPEGRLAFDSETLRAAARSALIDVLSCRENRSASGLVAQIAGDTIGADSFLPNMGTEEFLSCVSRPALEASCKDTPVLPRARVRDTRAALVDISGTAASSIPALFAPDAATLTEWLAKHEVAEGEDADATGATTDDQPPADDHPDDGDAGAEDGEAWTSPPSRALGPHISSERFPPPTSQSAAVLFPPRAMEDSMSAQLIYDLAPLGAIVRFSDGTPRPRRIGTARSSPPGRTPTAVDA